MAQITTTHGLMDEADLRRNDVHQENDNEIVDAVEYFLGDELVHRSVHVHLKHSQPPQG